MTDLIPERLLRSDRSREKKAVYTPLMSLSNICRFSGVAHIGTAKDSIIQTPISRTLILLS